MKEVITYKYIVVFYETMSNLGANKSQMYLTVPNSLTSKTFAYALRQNQQTFNQFHVSTPNGESKLTKVGGVIAW